MTFNDDARIDTSKVRRSRGARGAKIGGVGVLGVIVLALASQLLGVDLTPLAGVIGGGSPGSTSEVVALDDCQTGADANADDNCRMAAASDALDRYWEAQVSGYRSPGVELYTDAAQSQCGAATAAIGPFYCPSDESIYLDTQFFGNLREDFDASAGPLAQMYVLAHEWGHHISNITGSLSGGGGSGASSGSVRVELQADCFAGAWVGASSGVTDDSGTPFLQPVTAAQIADALDAAGAVGDDHIQASAGQRVNPDGFTHGSSEQRQRWFQTGLRGGPERCDTFAVPGSAL